MSFSTVVLVEVPFIPDSALNSLVAPVATSAHVSISTLRFLTALFLALPFALFHRSLRDPQLRLWASTIGGVSLVFIANGLLGLTHQLVTAVVVYILMRNLSRPLAAKVSFYWCFAYLSVMHLHRQYFHYLEGGADWTAAQMMLTVKLTSLAYSYADALTRTEHLLEDWKPLIVHKMPDIAHFFGFVFHFGSAVEGPAWGYNEFERFIDLSAFPQRQIPFSWTQVGKRLFQLVAVLIIHFILEDVFPMKYVTTDEFANSSVMYWYFYGCFASLGIRCQYYFVFTFSEVAADLSGASFNGYWSDGSTRWDRLNMMNILQVEFALSPRDTIANWNIQASRWFKLFIYFRMAPPGTKSSAWAQAFTNILSAFWHGFYPGYYIYWSIAALALIIAKEFRDRIRPRVLAFNSTLVKTSYDLVGILMIHAELAFASPSWGLLSFSLWHVYAMKVHYNFLLVMIATWAVLLFLIPRPSISSTRSSDTTTKAIKAD
jgi:lysophospholipid acyltransferase